MKKIKINLFFIINCIIFSVIFTSCSEDNDNFLPTHIKGLSIGSKQFFPVSEESSLKANNTSLIVSKYVDNQFVYDFVIQNNFDYKTFNTTSKEGSNMRVENKITNEFIDIINVVEYENYRTFDVINNLGFQVNGFTMEISDGDMSSKINPWTYVVAGIIEVIADIMTPSPLEQCREAMNSLPPCQSGSNPYMEFSEGGWFTSTICNIGCR